MADADGVQAWRPLRWRAVQWSNITNISRREVSYRGTDRYINIHTAGGHSFVLPAPIDSTNGHDPRFEEIFAVITNRWTAATGRTPASNKLGGE
jgi:hypothetical protein